MYDIDEEFKIAKVEVAKISNPKRRAAVRQSIRIHLDIMKLQFQLRVVRENFNQDQVYWAERLANLKYLKLSEAELNA